MIRYRFKTKEEFLEEFGWNWRNKIQCGWVTSGRMDYLFNMELKYDTYEYYIIGGKLPLDLRLKIGMWDISMDMLKEIGINYNDKKTLVYD